MKPPLPYTVLIVEDEQNTREGLAKALSGPQVEVLAAEDGMEALSLLQGRAVDVVLTDIRMPRMDGMQLLQEIRRRSPSTEVIILTAHGTIEMAVEAMQRGAFHYLTKPVNLDELDLLIERVLQKRTLERENERLREELRERYGLDEIICRSPKMLEVLDVVRHVAPTNTTVLILGENGVGKEVIARAIHASSPRRANRMISVNCAALSESLLESELFGHERGAFTGAHKQRKGRFELADKSTLFLDEISEISPDIQVKLLRVLEEREIERVGGSRPIKVDIRLITATNRDLAAMVESGRFREDLYFRLKVVTLRVPPLRERPEDIPLLVDHFITQFCRENGREKLRVTPEVIERMKAYSWPGNVRELRNMVESMVVLARRKNLTVDDLPPELRQVSEEPRLIARPLATLAEIEKQAILETLKAMGGNRTKTAERLGIGRRTLIRKLNEYGVNDRSQDDDAED